MTVNQAKTINANEAFQYVEVNFDQEELLAA
jgi:hypothetical protein